MEKHSIERDCKTIEEKGEIYFDIDTETITFTGSSDFIKCVFCCGGDRGGFPQRDETAEAGGGGG
ncbi:hypothetical protein CE91St56_04520 [Lachnospiraceae bacterium]|nr:hypothetical protein CE91St56_04520 [Lachnospiraceae bacterium]GKH39479.1 hypothetical protein CE91St57_04530 [Lachnospiraceae bacterium]